MDRPARHGARRRATIRDVAADAGVSLGAVSKVLREAHGVSEGLRARVRASIARLDYRPRASARGMRGQTYTLGMVIADIRNPFFADVVAGIDAAIGPTQYEALLGRSQADALNEAAIIEAMIDRQMDGLILTAPHLDAEALEGLAERVPLVVIGHHQKSARGFDTVNNDDALGASRVVHHLAECGYANIAMLSATIERIGGPMRTGVTGQRELGYETAMRALGLGEAISILRTPVHFEQIASMLTPLLSGPDRPEALVCWTDFVALEAISVARRLGLAVPEALGIAGYDNTMFCDFAQNELTSVDQSGRVLGVAAARLLIERIGGRAEPRHKLVEPRVIARASTQPRSPGLVQRRAGLSPAAG